MFIRRYRIEVKDDSKISEDNNTFHTNKEESTHELQENTTNDKIIGKQY